MPEAAYDPGYYGPAPVGYGTGVGLSDYLRQAWIGTQQIAAGVPAAARYMRGAPETALDQENLAADQYLQGRIRQAQNTTVLGMSPDAQKLRGSAVGSTDFWNNKFAWTALQIAGASPSIGAAVVGAAVTGGALPALATAGAVSGGLSAADYLETAQRSVDEASDQQMMGSSLYRVYRNQGMTENDAKQHLIADMSRYQVPLLFGLGVATGGTIGPEVQVAKAVGAGALRRAAVEAVPRGIAKRVGTGAVEGATGEGIQTFGESLGAQAGAVTAGFQPSIDVGQAAQEAAGGALVGGIIGGAAGIRPDYRPPQVAATQEEAQVEPQTGTDVIVRPGTQPVPPGGGAWSGGVRSGGQGSLPAQLKLPGSPEVKQVSGPDSAQVLALTHQDEAGRIPPASVMPRGAGYQLDFGQGFEREQQAQFEPIPAEPPRQLPAPELSGTLTPTPETQIRRPQQVLPSVQMRQLTDFLIQKAGTTQAAVDMVARHIADATDDELRQEFSQHQSQANPSDPVDVLWHILYTDELNRRNWMQTRNPQAPPEFTPEEREQLADQSKRKVWDFLQGKGYGLTPENAQAALGVEGPRRLLSSGTDEQLAELKAGQKQADIEHGRNVLNLQVGESRRAREPDEQLALPLRGRVQWLTQGQNSLAEVGDLQLAVRPRGSQRGIDVWEWSVVDVDGKPVAKGLTDNRENGQRNAVQAAKLPEPADIPEETRLFETIEEPRAEPKRSHKGEKFIAGRAAEDQKTRELFETAPKAEGPETPEQLTDRLQRIVDEANNRGIGQRGKISYESTEPATFWLNGVRGVLSSLTSGAMTPGKYSRAVEFQSNEEQARSGDWSGFIRTRGEIGGGQSLDQDEGDSRVAGIPALLATQTGEAEVPLHELIGTGRPLKEPQYPKELRRSRRENVPVAIPETATMEAGQMVVRGTTPKRKRQEKLPVTHLTAEDLEGPVRESLGLGKQGPAENADQAAKYLAAAAELSGVGEKKGKTKLLQVALDKAIAATKALATRLRDEARMSDDELLARQKLRVLTKKAEHKEAPSSVPQKLFEDARQAVFDLKSRLPADSTLRGRVEQAEKALERAGRKVPRPRLSMKKAEEHKHALEGELEAAKAGRIEKAQAALAEHVPPLRKEAREKQREKELAEKGGAKSLTETYTPPAAPKAAEPKADIKSLRQQAEAQGAADFAAGRRANPYLVKKGGRLINLQMAASWTRGFNKALRAAAREKGEKAGRAGRGPEANPFEQGQMGWGDWNAGWTAANREAAIQGRARLAEELAKVQEGTEKQRKADNFQKGHIRIGGLEISLTKRKGKQGTILNTKGLDGKNVEVMLGPRATDAHPLRPNLSGPLSVPYYKGRQAAANGLGEARNPYTKKAQSDAWVAGHQDVTGVHTLIIQQQGADGQFLGHKVMLGFNSQDEARQAYIDAFGAERIADERPVTNTELKYWLSHSGPLKSLTGLVGDQTLVSKFKRGKGRGVSYSISREEWAAMSPEERAAATNTHIEGIIGHPSEPLSNYLGDIAAQMEPFVSSLSKDLQERMRQIIRRVTTLAADVPTYVLSDEDFEKTFGRLAGGAYESNYDVVGLRKAHLGIPEKTLHEATHAALKRAVHSDPQLQREAEKLLDALREEAARRGQDHYGLANVDEMMSGIFDDPAFRMFLRAEPKLNLWQRAVNWVTSALGFGPHFRPGIERLMNLMERVQEHAETNTFPRGILASKELRASMAASAERTQFRGSPDISFAMDWREHLPENLRGAPRQRQMGTPWLTSLRTSDQLAQLAKSFGAGFGKAARRVSNAFEQMRVATDRILAASEPLLSHFYKLEKQYRGNPMWEKFVTLLHDETMYGVYADRPIDAQPHLLSRAKTPQFAQTLHSAQARKQWAELNRTWQSLPQDLKDARKKALDHYSETQNIIGTELGANRFMEAITGLVDADLLERVLNGEETKADIDAVGSDVIDAVHEATQKFRTLRGPYFPFMRRGDYVVNAKYKVARPAAALRAIQALDGEGNIIENTWEFTGPNARDNAMAYASTHDQKAFVRGIWVDTATNRPYDKGVPDAVAEHRYRVRVVDQHTEFFDTMGQAQVRAAELEGNSSFDSVAGVEAKRWTQGGQEATLQKAGFDRMLKRMEKSSRFTDLPPGQKNAIRELLREAALQSLNSTRISARRLPRGYVQGMSTDFVRNMYDYSQSSASYISHLRHLPELESALQDLEAGVASDDYSKEGTAARRAIANELTKRARANAATAEPSALDSGIRRITQLAFLNFLASPAYSINNLLQVAMVSLPYIGGQYGFGYSSSQLYKAYQDISGLRILGAGLKATKERILGRAGAEDFVSQIIAGGNLSQAEKAMLRRLQDLGVLGGETGIEVGRLIRQREGLMGYPDTALGYMTEASRAMPRSTEAVNRAATALATFRMEMQRTGDIEMATLKAQEVTNLTQGLYSASDAAPIFNSKLGQLSLIFKKYGQLMYGLIGHQIGRIIRNAEPGDRKEAIKGLIYMAAAHVAVAGALGLPTDPFKALIIGLNVAGVTDVNWSDVEFATREIMTELFGAGAGEALTRGLPRLLGIDLSNRVGLQDMLLYGEPESREPADLKKYAFDVFSGAPAGMALTLTGAAQDVAKGDFVSAGSKLPLKVLSNAMKAYQEATVGKETGAGYSIVDPSSLSGTLSRALGYTPAVQAETQEARTYFFQKQRQQLKARNEWLHDYEKAGSSERSRLWPQIVQWNRSQPAGLQIKQADLKTYSKRRGREVVVHGIKVNKTNRALLEQVQGAYQSMQ